MINYTNKFFNLNLFKIKDIKLHETTETNRLRNIFERISNSKHLMNPVIVGQYDDELILIDGANRLSTLKEIGCKLIIAQITDYRDRKIKLRNWNHFIYDIGINEVKEFCDRNKFTYNETSYKEGKGFLKNNHNCVLVSDIISGKVLTIKLPRKFDDNVKRLNDFTKFYFNVYNFDRSEEEIIFKDLCKYSRRKGVLVEFFKFRKEQIVKIAKSKAKLPAGISRHILDTRVLHVRYEISKLKDDKDIEVKREDLNKYLISKIDSNKVRQYRESVIVFDE
jgi:L-serine kinase (ATP) / ParB family transcriptional regulator, heme-responsive regulator